LVPPWYFFFGLFAWLNGTRWVSLLFSWFFLWFQFFLAVMDFLLLLSTHVGLCWPFMLVFAASVPVFSPSFSSGFGGLFNRSYLLVLSFELSYIFFLVYSLLPFPPVSSFHYCPLKFIFCPLLVWLHFFICSSHCYLLTFWSCYFFIYFCVILVFVAWLLIMVLLLLPFLFFHCAWFIGLSLPMPRFIS